MTLRARIITVSDRAAAGVYDDRSGPAAAAALEAAGCTIAGTELVPDGIDSVRAAIERAIAAGTELVLTTGGTGVGPRDLTPEATAPLLELRLTGIEEAVRAYGMRQVPTAMLSRGCIGLTTRGPEAVLIVNAPGSTGGVRDTIAVIAPVLEHVIGQARGDAAGHAD